MCWSCPCLCVPWNDVQRAVHKVRVHNVCEDPDRAFKPVLEVGRILVQMLGVAPHRLLDQ